MFGEATEKAVQAEKNGEIFDNQTTTPDQAPDSGNQSDNSSAPGLETQSGEQTPKDILDLQKLGKFKFEGQEMTYDELRKAYLRQQDYSKKTQALAEERKYSDNLAADLRSVAKDPRLAEEFKRVYPERFHSYLELIMQRAQNSAQASGQAPASNFGELPKEFVDRLERSEKLLNEFQQESQETTKATLDSMFSGFENDLKAKYPRADWVHVYSAITDYLEANNLTSKDLIRNKSATTKLFEDYTKRSHEAVTKQFEAWGKEQLEQVRRSNQAGADIGRGGGTPTAAPKKYNRLKDVAEDMIASLE